MDMGMIVAVNAFYLCFGDLGHHELPPLAHTTMLRDFPVSLQHSGDAVIPPRSPASPAVPVSPASHYHQRYVSCSHFDFCAAALVVIVQSVGQHRKVTLHFSQQQTLVPWFTHRDQHSVFSQLLLIQSSHAERFDLFAKCLSYALPHHSGGE